MLKQNLIISLPTLHFVGMQQEPHIFHLALASQSQLLSPALSPLFVDP